MVDVIQVLSKKVATMDVRVQTLIDFMQQNLDNGKRLGLPEMARIVGLSVSRFRCLFAIETGISPKAFLRKLRLTRAKDLLAEDRLSIDEVAMKLGWQDRSHFERRFKQLHGMTPARYRNRERSKFLSNHLNNHNGHSADRTAIG